MIEIFSRVKRSVRALFVLGFFMNVLAAVGGTFILIVGYSRQDVTQPLWQSGQIVMIMATINLAAFAAAFFQTRKLLIILSGVSGVGPK